MLEDYVNELREAADATDQENAALAAGDWCTFCPAKAVCTELQNSARKTLGVDFEDMEGLDDDDLAEVGRSIADDQHKNGDLALSLKMAPLIETWLKAINAHGFDELKAGRPVEGQKLVRKRSNRRWINKQDAAETLGQLYDDDQIYKPRELKSFTEVEKLTDASAVVGSLVEKSEGTLTMAPEDDPRDAIVVSAGDDFEGLEDEGE